MNDIAFALTGICIVVIVAALAIGIFVDPLPDDRDPD